MMYQTMNRQGFSLIELLVVVLIISVLAAVALPQYQKAVEKSRAVQALTMVKAISKAQDLYHMEAKKYATSLEELSIDIPGEDIIYDTRHRKHYNFFDFGTQCIPSVEAKAPCLAVSNRWNTSSPTPSESHYSFIRFKHDPRIFCCVDSMHDPYEVCRRFTSSSSIEIADMPCYPL